MAGLHSQVLGHLAKRSIQYAARSTSDLSSQHGLRKALEKHEGTPHENPRELLSKMLLSMMLMFLVSLLVYLPIRYILGQVVASLAMIEQPRTAVVLAETDEADAPLNRNKTNGRGGNTDEELLILREKPVTASIRATLRHLISIGGRRALFRGLAIAIVYNLSLGVLTELFGVVVSLIVNLPPLAMIISSTIASVCLVRIHMTWTHIVISEPSPLRWYRRIPRGKTYFKALLTPTIIFSVCQHMSIWLPILTWFAFGPMDVDNIDTKKLVVRLVVTLLVAGFVGVMVVLPASVTLTRVEASLLPDDAETIVHFDRTLGGASANLVGFGKINFIALYDAAWRSFDRASRIRLVKFYVKYYLITIAFLVVFVLAFWAQIAFLTRGKSEVLMQTALAQMQIAGIHD